MAEPEIVERLPLQNVPDRAIEDLTRLAPVAHRWLPPGKLWVPEDGRRWRGLDPPEAPEPAAELERWQGAGEELERLQARWEATFAGIAKTDTATTSVRPRRKARELARVAWAEWQAAVEAEAAREADYLLARLHQTVSVPDWLEQAIRRLERLQLEAEAALSALRRYRLSTYPAGRRQLGEHDLLLMRRSMALSRAQRAREQLDAGPPAELFEEAEALSAAES